MVLLAGLCRAAVLGSAIAVTDGHARVDIYVRLLGLPYEQWRLASARPLDGDRYELLGAVPSEEQWEFQPGEIVECEEVVLTLGGYGLLAVSKAMGNS